MAQVKWLAENQADPTQYVGGVTEDREHKSILQEIRDILVNKAIAKEYNWGDKFRVHLFSHKILDAWTIILRGRDLPIDDSYRYIVTQFWVYKRVGKEYYRYTQETGWDCPIPKISDDALAYFNDPRELEEFLTKTARRESGYKHFPKKLLS